MIYIKNKWNFLLNKAMNNKNNNNNHNNKFKYVENLILVYIIKNKKNNYKIFLNKKNNNKNNSKKTKY